MRRGRVTRSFFPILPHALLWYLGVSGSPLEQKCPFHTFHDFTPAREVMEREASCHPSGPWSKVTFLPWPQEASKIADSY